MLRSVIVLLLSSVIISQVSGYRILGIFPLNSRSHEMMFEALMKGLAKRGHQVDVVTHFSVKNPPKNYKTVVNLAGTMETLVNNFTIDFALSVRGDVGYHVATTFGNRLCNLLALKEMQDLIHNPPNDPPYDVLITEAFGSTCFMGIAHHFNIPIVAASSAVEYPWVSDFTGNNDNPAVVPNALYMAFGQLNFWQRLENTILYHKEVMSYHSLTDKFQTDIMRKYINPNIPNIREVERSVALTLVNSHPILFGVKSVLPTVVQTAGLHIEENDATLPKDLKKWMDESKDGVVYFTFGSMVIIETLPVDKLKALYASFAKISPVRVLMKIADKTKLPPGLPNNILTLPWIPQQPILAHNNTKAFMTHGGLMGSQEALYYGIPMIGVPIFADQPRNVASFVAKNMSIQLQLEDISEETLDAALKAILFDPKYRMSAKHHSKLFKDNPLSSMDSAEFWIKYIIRNGPHVLRPPSLNLTWWQLALLDVYAFIILASIMAKLVLYYALKFILQKFGICTKSNQIRNEKKRN
ncbi:UDP-glucuronosyltransferase 2A1 [Nasonia vitripennis]|uniref:UDP-glucuronosyltransferase n=1 Tax=Nasonia vitripennis TaxID=7425 RepID=A0A7M7G4F5_NASVI|nr:UDP-glucuronosyltransferase 2A1 [Nasonia vitripennis]